MDDQKKAALLSELNALFGKPAQKEAKRKPSLTPSDVRRPKPITKEFLENLTDTKRQTEIMLRDRVWIPVAIVHHLQQQSCRSCHDVQSYHAGTLIRHKFYKSESFWEYDRPRETVDRHLPEIVATEKSSIHECANCIERRVFNRETIERDEHGRIKLHTQPDISPEHTKH